MELMTTKQSPSKDSNPKDLQTTLLVFLLFLMAMSLIVFSGFTFFSMISSDFDLTTLIRTIAEVTIGIILLILTKLVRKGNEIAIFLIGAAGIISILYDLFFKRGFNLFVIIITGCCGWLLLYRWKTKSEEFCKKDKAMGELKQAPLIEPENQLPKTSVLNLLKTANIYTTLFAGVISATSISVLIHIAYFCDVPENKFIYFAVYTVIVAVVLPFYLWVFGIDNKSIFSSYLKIFIFTPSLLQFARWLVYAFVTVILVVIYIVIMSSITGVDI